MLVLVPQAFVLTLQAVVVAVYVVVARQSVTQSRDLPVLLLDYKVPRILLRRTPVKLNGLAQKPNARVGD